MLFIYDIDCLFIILIKMKEKYFEENLIFFFVLIIIFNFNNIPQFCKTKINVVFASFYVY